MTVFVTDIIDDLLPPVLTDVDIDIRHFITAGIHEPLEQQVVFNRIDITQPKQIPDHRADTRASGPHGDAVVAGVVTKIPDDQKIGAELFRDDDGELVFQPLANVGGNFGGAVTPDQPFFAKLRDVKFIIRFGGMGVPPMFFVYCRVRTADRFIIRQGKRIGPQCGPYRIQDHGRDAHATSEFFLRDFINRRISLREIQFQIAHVGDADGVIHRLGEALHRLGHFIGAF